MAADFAAATASCNVPDYAYTSPPAFALNNTATRSSTAPAPQQTCQGGPPKAVAQGDTCHSIAATNGVSSYGLMTLNNIDVFCSKLPAQVCLPQPCTLYKWQPYDTCEVISARAGITLAQFLAWNPIFDEVCSNAQRWRGWNVCIG